MHQVTIEEMTSQLAQLIEEASQGEEIVIVRDNAPVARLGPVAPAKAPRQPGSAKDVILYMAEDFDAPLEDFKEYM